jgi:precorrin isomerase
MGYGRARAAGLALQPSFIIGSAPTALQSVLESENLRDFRAQIFDGM